MERAEKKRKRLERAIESELIAVESREQKIEIKKEQAASKTGSNNWKSQMESKIPPKVYGGLESAFCKGFSVVFSQGYRVIEKSYKKQELQEDYAIREYAVQIKSGRKQLKQMQKSAHRADTLNLALTTLEGIGLGVLGIGMPDIVLFLGTMLKGIYETALNYGFDYEERREQFLILKMMAAAMSSGEDWWRWNEEIDIKLEGELPNVSEEIFLAQLKRTASAFAVDMLLLKFIQGVPIVGILGGAANPVYYHKVLNYVQLKYQKRYLLRLKKKLREENNHEMVKTVVESYHTKESKQ